ncbi:MAG: oligosaccharide flippase family protein [Ignavibacteriae bacterium]|nr:oligosaccharide flippase family protein [Ignavibacteriota bacterium]
MLDKLKRLSKDTMIYGTSTIIGRFLNFLFVPIYTNLFLPGEFGIVANIYAYIAILNVFLSVGLESGYFKFASTLEVGSEKENFSHPFLGIFLNSFLLSGVLFVFAGDFTYLFQIDPSQAGLLRWTALILFFDAISLVPFAYLRLQHKPMKFAVIRIANIVLNVAFNLLFILVLRKGIEYVFISNVIASGVTFLLLTPIVFRNFKISFNKKLWSELLRFSLPYIPAGISSNIIQVVNRPILTALTNDTTVGIFQANYRLGIFMMLFVSMFEFAWRPFFLQNAKEPNAKEIFAKVMTAFVVLMSLVFLILTYFIDDIVSIKLPGKGHLLGMAYWSGLVIVPVILLAYFFYGIYINLMAGIYIEKKTKYLPYITGGAAVINVAANFLLIPQMNMMGSAIATLLSYIVMAGGIYYWAQKYYYIKYEFGKIGMLFILIAVFYIVFESLQRLFGTVGAGGIIVTDSWFWAVKIGLILLFVTLIFVSNIIDYKVIRRFI